MQQRRSSAVILESMAFTRGPGYAYRESVRAVVSTGDGSLPDGTPDHGSAQPGDDMSRVPLDAPGERPDLNGRDTSGRTDTGTFATIPSPMPSPRVAAAAPVEAEDLGERPRPAAVDADADGAGAPPESRRHGRHVLDRAARRQQRRKQAS